MAGATRPALRTGGVFNFGKRNEGADPVASLRACLQEPSVWFDLTESVVVLPEAFNVVGEYWVPNRRRFDASISSSLRKISVDFGVALVAGLIENESSGLGYSAAYLIDGDVRKLLSRKMKDDRSGVYRPCPTAESDELAPYRGIYLAALICVDGLDFNPHGPSDRQSTLLRRIAGCKPSATALCVPSHSAEYYTPGVAQNWPSYLHVLIANSSPGQPSVMRISGKGAAGPEFKGADNRICMATLEGVL